MLLLNVCTTASNFFSSPPLAPTLTYSTIHNTTDLSGTRCMYVIFYMYVHIIRDENCYVNMFHIKHSWYFLTYRQDTFIYTNNLSVYVMLHSTNSLTIIFKATENMTFVSYLSEISFLSELYIKQGGYNVCTACQFTSDVRFTKTQNKRSVATSLLCKYFHITCY